MQEGDVSGDTIAGAGSPAPAPGPTGPEVIIRNTAGIGTRHQAKNLSQLRSSVDACFGPGMTTIKASMLLATNGAPPAAGTDGRAPFLARATHPEGSDVLSVESAFLLDPARSDRFGVDADAIAAPYLRALETVANVVAHNCEPTSASCDCGSVAKAKDLMARCLPGFDPASAAFTHAARVLAAQCAAGPAGFREAIASLVASYAFAVSH